MAVSGKKQPALPWEDLEHYLYSHFENLRFHHPGTQFDRKVQPGAAAHMLNVSTQTIHRYVLYGVPFYSADRIASELSTHPMEIWPAHYLEVQLCG